MSNPMGLTIPDTTTSGPTYANDVSDALTTIAGHTHVAGSGNPIPTAGLALDADLTHAGFNATHLKSTRFDSQASPLGGVSDVGCLYVSGGDLYYNDGAGTKIQLTKNHAFNAALLGAFTTLAGTSAAATYDSVSGTFTFTSNTGINATLSVGPLNIAEPVLNAKLITIKSPTSLANAYNLILPTALPSSTSMLQLDSSGKISARTTSERYVKSASSGAVSTSSNTFVDVTNLSVTLTTTGRPVMVCLVPDDSINTPQNLGGVATSAGGTYNLAVSYQIDVDAGARKIGLTPLGLTTGLAVSGQTDMAWGAGSVMVVDVPAAGSHTYKLQYKITTGSSVKVNNLMLVACEL